MMTKIVNNFASSLDKDYKDSQGLCRQSKRESKVYGGGYIIIYCMYNSKPYQLHIHYKWRNNKIKTDVCIGCLNIYKNTLSRTDGLILKQIMKQKMDDGLKELIFKLWDKVVQQYKKTMVSHLKYFDYISNF